jgi:hypothetical protein
MLFFHARLFLKNFDQMSQVIHWLCVTPWPPDIAEFHKGLRELTSSFPCSLREHVNTAFDKSPERMYISKR